LVINSYFKPNARYNHPNLDILDRFSLTVSNITFHETTSTGNSVDTRGQTDRTEKQDKANRCFSWLTRTGTKTNQDATVMDLIRLLCCCVN